MPYKLNDAEFLAKLDEYSKRLSPGDGPSPETPVFYVGEEEKSPIDREKTLADFTYAYLTNEERAQLLATA